MSLLKNISDVLAGKASLGEVRSGKWPGVRATHLKANPTCAVCDGTTKLEVHHIMPFHLDPTKELDPTNLLTLCESSENGINCHLAFGHVGNYQCVNKTSKQDAKVWNAKFKKRRAEQAKKAAADKAKAVVK